MDASTRSAEYLQSTAYWVRLITLGLLAGFVVIALTPAVAEAGRKFIALGIIGLVILLTAKASNRGREVFLFVWVISLTYNRGFWSFAPLVGDHGAFGPYWMISDVVLLALLAHWAYEAIILKIPNQAKALPFLPWYAPWAIAATLSVVGAPEPAWALGDLVRVFKLGLVMMYFRYKIGPREWWVVVVALGTAVVIQSGFGMLEVITGRTGVLGLLGLGGSVGEQLGVKEFFGGWTRATGTVAHPPYLAAFLLLSVPMFVSLGLTLGWSLLKWICLGVAAAGLIGIICTLTRVPIAIALFQMFLLVLILMSMRMLSLTRVIGLGAFVGLALCIVGAVGAEFIYERFTGDFKLSVDARWHGYEVAGRMLLDHPIFGLGLNNYGHFMQEYDPGSVWGIEQKWHDYATQLTHMRLLAGPLNGYLYVATVTGLLGLAGFLWFAIGGLVMGVRAVRATAVWQITHAGEGIRYSPKRAACVGMIVGLIGLYLSQITSYSIWIDTVMSVWVLLIALLGCAAFQGADDQSTE